MRGLEEPGRARSAPVNAPRSTPNISASRRLSGMAAQLTSTKGPPRRELAAWSARATSPLPVPVSPWRSTGGIRPLSARRPTTRVTCSRTAGDGRTLPDQFREQHGRKDSRRARRCSTFDSPAAGRGTTTLRRVNVLGRYLTGRFSGVHDWPVLGVHRADGGSGEGQGLSVALRERSHRGRATGPPVGRAVCGGRRRWQTRGRAEPGAGIGAQAR